MLRRRCGSSHTVSLPQLRILRVLLLLLLIMVGPPFLLWGVSSPLLLHVVVIQLLLSDRLNGYTQKHPPPSGARTVLSAHSSQHPVRRLNSVIHCLPFLYYAAGWTLAVLLLALLFAPVATRMVCCLRNVVAADLTKQIGLLPISVTRLASVECKCWFIGRLYFYVSHTTFTARCVCIRGL